MKLEGLGQNFLHLLASGDANFDVKVGPTFSVNPFIHGHLKRNSDGLRDNKKRLSAVLSQILKLDKIIHYSHRRSVNPVLT